MRLSELVSAVEDARSSGTAAVVQSYQASESLDNEFLLFLKPELTGLGAESLGSVLNLVDESLARFKVSVVSKFVVTGQQLIANGSMRDHYGVIDSVSRRSAAVISPKLKEQILETFPGTSVLLGGHEFLDQFADFSAGALTVLYENLASQRFAGGVHGAPLRYRGSQLVLLNGFHPDQIDRYEQPETTLLVLVCRTQTAWRTIRQSMLGGTNPSKAEDGSLRSQILARSEGLGLRYFNSSMNGFHASAGPLEASVEIARFYSLADERLEESGTTFGSAAADLVAGPTLAELVSNPVVESALGSGPMFDVTEEVDAGRVLEAWSGIRVADSR